MAVPSDDERRRMSELSEKVIGAAFEVSNVLGIGFLEKVYETALVQELRIRGIKAEAQKRVLVRYKGIVVGEYFADLLVEDRLLIELKACDGIVNENVAQTLNYLRAAGLWLGLLLNFGKPKLEIKRLVGNPDALPPA